MISNKITEDIQIECVARFGLVFQRKGGRDAMEYWQVVWDWLRSQHKHLCLHPDLTYPSQQNTGDMELLDQIWDWQDTHYTGRKDK